MLLAGIQGIAAAVVEVAAAKVLMPARAPGRAGRQGAANMAPAAVFVVVAERKPAVAGPAVVWLEEQYQLLRVQLVDCIAPLTAGDWDRARGQLPMVRWASPECFDPLVENRKMRSGRL